MAWSIPRADLASSICARRHRLPLDCPLRRSVHSPDGQWHPPPLGQLVLTFYQAPTPGHYRPTRRPRPRSRVIYTSSKPLRAMQRYRPGLVIQDRVLSISIASPDPHLPPVPIPASKHHPLVQAHLTTGREEKSATRPTGFAPTTTRPRPPRSAMFPAHLSWGSL